MTSQAPRCCFTISSLCPSIFKLDFHALILHFKVSIENWVITSWWRCSKVTQPPPLSFFSNTPFPPLPSGRPLIQHTQYYIPQVVRAPSTLHKHSRPPLSTACRDNKPWPQLLPQQGSGLANENFDWWDIAIEQPQRPCDDKRKATVALKKTVSATFNLQKPALSKTFTVCHTGASHVSAGRLAAAIVRRRPQTTFSSDPRILKVCRTLAHSYGFTLPRLSIIAWLSRQHSTCPALLCTGNESIWWLTQIFLIF